MRPAHFALAPFKPSSKVHFIVPGGTSRRAWEKRRQKRILAALSYNQSVRRPEIRMDFRRTQNFFFASKNPQDFSMP